MIFLKRGDLMGKRPPQFLWLEVTKDEYEFIIDLIREENPVPTAEKNKDEYSKEKFLDQVYMTEAKYDRLKAVLEKKKNIIMRNYFINYLGLMLSY